MTPGHQVVAFVITNLTLNPATIIFGYVAQSFGGEGSIVSVDNLEDVVGVISVALLLITGGIFTYQALCLARRGFHLVWRSLLSPTA